MMTIRKCMILGLLIFMPSVLWAQKEDYSEEYKQKAEEQEGLKDRKETLADSLEEWKSYLKTMGTQRKTLRKEIKRTENKIKTVQRTIRKSEVPDLQQKRDQLMKQMAELQEKEEKLHADMKQAISSLNAKRLEERELETIRDKKTRMLISEYQASLEKPFSQMKTEELRQIKEACRPFLVDHNLVVFSEKIEGTINNKEIYDRMVAAVSQPYQQQRVDNVLAAVTQIKNANSQQQREIRDVEKQLKDFPQGLAAFKEYIQALNRVREGVDNYTLEFFKDDEKGILANNHLGQRIEQKVKTVPYLKEKFEAFMNAFKANPNQHADVETEILNQ